jgi:hypothetical protein
MIPERAMNLKSLGTVVPLILLGLLCLVILVAKQRQQAGSQEAGVSDSLYRPQPVHKEAKASDKIEIDRGAAEAHWDRAREQIAKPLRSRDWPIDPPFLSSDLSKWPFNLGQDKVLLLLHLALALTEMHGYMDGALEKACIQKYAAISEEFGAWAFSSYHKRYAVAYRCAALAILLSVSAHSTEMKELIEKEWKWCQGIGIGREGTSLGSLGGGRI